MRGDRGGEVGMNLEARLERKVRLAVMEGRGIGGSKVAGVALDGVHWGVMG